MFSIIDVFYLVFSQLAVGGFVLLFLVPKGLIGANFYRLMGGIYLLVSGLARCANLALHQQPVTFLNFFGYWQNPEAISVISFFLIVLVWTLTWWFKTPLLTRIFFWGGVISGVASIVLSAQRYLHIIQIPGETFLLPLQFLTAAVTIGCCPHGYVVWSLVPRSPRFTRALSETV